MLGACQWWVFVFTKRQLLYNSFSNLSICVRKQLIPDPPVDHIHIISIN